MPDLTIENYWICQEYHDWCSLPRAIREKEKAPKCTWHQYIHGGKPNKQKRCPKCNGELVSVQVGV